MTIGRDLVQQAFPNQPRMQAAFESLVADAEDATDRLKQAVAAIGTLADGAEGIVAQLAQKQPKNDTLSAISQLPTDPGVIEQIQPGIISIRQIDSADTKSLLTRNEADSRYLGGAHGAASAAKLTTARNIAMTGDVAWNVTFDGSAPVTAAGTIQANAVTFSKFVAATQKALIGANAAGNFQEITLGSGLSLTAGVLSTTGSGTVTSVSGTANEISVATGTTTPVISLPAALTFTGKTITGGTFSTPTLTTPVINGLPTGTGVAATSTASTLVARDANKNILANNFLADYTTTATAAGTTVLTVSSTYLQFFTGVTTQTITLPVASTLALGQQFQIVNLSTGALTVNSSGGNLVLTIAGGTSATMTCILTSGTTAASWSASYWADAVTGGKKLTLITSYTQATSFPASPATDDICYRTDRRIEYYWDGTRWLSTQLLYVSIPNTDFLLPRTATTLGMCRTANPFAALYAIYVVDAVFHNFITATSTWTLAIIDNDASVATTLATRSTSGDAINTHLSNRVTVNAVVASTVDNLQGEATLVSGAASLYCSFGLTYRLIG